MNTIKEYIKNNKILQEYEKCNIDTKTDRWEEGIEHHPNSLELMKHLCELDFAFFNDHHSFKMGGDGDNGETLMYIMDLYFELKDKKAKEEYEKF